MYSRLRRNLYVWAASALLLVLSGCSNNPYPADQASQNYINTIFSEQPRTFDPSVAYSVDDSEVIDNIYPGYFKYDYLKRNPYQLDLALGAAEPIRRPYIYVETKKGHPIQVHGEEWVFHIKPGLHFQDDPCFPGGKGREIVAADFLYSFRRMADPNVNCPVLNFFSDKIIGFSDYVALQTDLSNKKQPADYTTPVAGLVLNPSDPYQFTIRLNQPYPQLRYLMEMHFTSPIPHEAVEHYGDDFKWHPVGSGMYKLSEYVPKQRIVLTVNENHFPATYPTEGMPGDREAGLLRDAGKPLPLNKGVIFTYIPESITQWNQFLQGYLDSYGVTQENASQVMTQPGKLSPDMSKRGVQFTQQVQAATWYIGFNMTDPTVGGYTAQQRKLRQAISMAIDSPTYIDLFQSGFGLPAQFSIPPGLFGYDPSFKNPYCQYNLQKAKELLAQAGYKDGIDPKTGGPLTLYYDNAATDSASRQQVLWLVKQFSALGINLVSRTWRWSILQERQEKGQFQVMQLGWFADYPDPENFLFLLYGPNIRPGPNYCAYNSPEYNRLFVQMRQMNDGPARMAVIAKMRAIAVEDCPWVYLFHEATPGIHYDWVRNYKSNAIAYDTATYRTIDTEERTRKQAEWNHPIYWPILVFIVVLIGVSLPAANIVVKRRRRHIRKA